MPKIVFHLFGQSDLTKVQSKQQTILLQLHQSSMLVWLLIGKTEQILVPSSEDLQKEIVQYLPGNLTIFYQNLVKKLAKPICLLAIKKDKKPTTLQCFGDVHFQVLLYRNQKLSQLPMSPMGLSGEFMTGDTLLWGTSDFIKLTTQHIQLALHSNSWLELAKILGHDSSKIGGIVQYLSKTPPSFPKIPNLTKLRFNPQDIKYKLFDQTNYISKRQGTFSKKRRIALGIAFLFLLLLGGSLGLGYCKKMQFNQEKQEQQLAEAITYKLNQATSLQNLNPNRAKTLLNEAKQILEEYEQNTDQATQIKSLQEKLDEAYAQVARQHQVREPEIFYDLSLFRDGFSLSQMSLSEDDLVLLDQDNQVLALLNVESKAIKILAGKDLVFTDTTLASIPAWVFLASDSKIQIIDKQSGKQLQSFRLSKITIDQILGYSNNVYVLDKNLGQLWRFRGIKDSLAEPDAFFSQEQDLQEINDFAIDGSVWLLRADGGVEQYTMGLRDAYYPSFSLDVPLKNPQRIITDEDCKNLYILDQANNRIVVISKQGEYVGQYLWDKIQEIDTITVSENLGKILLGLDDKIYGIDLQK
ncbi:hypothetical protein GYA49_06130 [Candidatus Beckwithbacteria bacterium]|nr:hypothetical protein [Candidatus Beckwithbacteria bacterium]